MATINLKPKKSRGGGAFWRIVPGYFPITRPDILDFIREGDEVNFDGGCEHLELFACLKTAEPAMTFKVPSYFSEGVAMLNRVIRHGGFVQYIQALENTDRREEHESIGK